MSLFKPDGTRIQPPLEPLMKFYRWQFFSVIVCPPWWRHPMETFSALLALCEGNPPVTGGFHSQMLVTQNFDVFFDLRLNKRLSKQSGRRWFEMPSRSLWTHKNEHLGIPGFIDTHAQYPFLHTYTHVAIRIHVILKKNNKFLYILLIYHMRLWISYSAIWLVNICD